MVVQYYMSKHVAANITHNETQPQFGLVGDSDVLCCVPCPTEVRAGNDVAPELTVFQFKTQKPRWIALVRVNMVSNTS